MSFNRNCAFIGKRPFLFFLFIIITAVSLHAQPLELPAMAESEIKVADARVHLEFLASDALEGRHTLEKGSRVAAEYISCMFKSWDLKPFRAKDYKVPFYFNKAKLTQDQKFVLFDGNQQIRAEYLLDYFIQFDKHPSISFDLPLHFCGYGLVAEEYHWNDFKGVNLKGAAAVVFDDLPDLRDESGNSIYGKRVGKYRNPLNKVKAAMKAGAKMMLVIVPENKFHDKLERYRRSVTRTVYYTNSQLNTRIPILFINEGFAKTLFKRQKLSISGLKQKMESSNKSFNFRFKNYRLAADIKFSQELKKGWNVIGYKEGSDPQLKDEIVTICAHYDHLGITDGEVYNGADDNASGTSGMMELAELFSQHVQPKRSMLFIGFSGEELGLLGSRYFVENLGDKLTKMVTCINLDMIGRGEENKIKVIGLGYSTDLKNINIECNKETGFEMSYRDMFFTSRSDQWPFLKNKIPSIFYFAGMHDDYHEPGDDFHKINYEKMIKITKLAAKVAYHVAQTPDKPKWHEKKVIKK